MAIRRKITIDHGLNLRGSGTAAGSAPWTSPMPARRTCSRSGCRGCSASKTRPRTSSRPPTPSACPATPSRRWTSSSPLAGPADGVAALDQLGVAHRVVYAGRIVVQHLEFARHQDRAVSELDRLLAKYFDHLRLPGREAEWARFTGVRCRARCGWSRRTRCGCWRSPLICFIVLEQRCLALDHRATGVLDQPIVRWNVDPDRALAAHIKP